MTNYTPATRPWRSLLRVIAVHDYQVEIVIPGWSTTETIFLNIADIPSDIVAKLELDYRFHARVNIGACCKEDLTFTDWESK